MGTIIPKGSVIISIEEYDELRKTRDEFNKVAGNIEDKVFIHESLISNKSTRFEFKDKVLLQTKEFFEKEIEDLKEKHKKEINYYKESSKSTNICLKELYNKEATLSHISKKFLFKVLFKKKADKYYEKIKKDTV